MRFVMAFVLCAVVSSSFEVEAQVGRNFDAAGTGQRPVDAARMRRWLSLVTSVPGFNYPWYGSPFLLESDLFYRPFSWAAPIYPAPVVPVPIYLEPLYTRLPYLGIKQTNSITLNRVEELSYRLGRLTKEIERMRREGGQQPQTAPESAPPPETTETTLLPTILVFSDGRRMEIQDYAIADQTLWVFMERGSTRIPITDLDLEATRDVNAARGVRFPLPK